MHKNFLVISSLIISFFLISSCRTKLSESQENSVHDEETRSGEAAKEKKKNSY